MRDDKIYVWINIFLKGKAYKTVDHLWEHIDILYIVLFFPLFLPSMEALKDVVALIWKKSQS